MCTDKKQLKEQYLENYFFKTWKFGLENKIPNKQEHSLRPTKHN